MILVLALLAGCHWRTNPLDPGSTTWTGEDVSRTHNDAEQTYPDIVRWESVAEHGFDNFIALEVTDGFIEPRFPDTRPLYVVLTFAEGITESQARDLFIVGSMRDLSATGTKIYPPGEIIYDHQRSRVVAVPVDLTGWVLPEAGAARMRVAEPSGFVLGERTMHYLPGDFDGDGIVTVGTDDMDGPDAHDGFFVGSADVQLIRSDMDADGIVEGLGFDDDMIVSNNAGISTVALPPEF